MNKMLFWVALCIVYFLLTSCAIDKKLPPAPPVTSPLIEQIKALQDSEAYKKLDQTDNIAGTDVNKNGVRDDVDEWIEAQSYSEAQKQTAYEKAKSLQKTLLVDFKDKDALRKVADEYYSAGELHLTNRREKFHIEAKILAVTLNTKKRHLRFSEFRRTLENLAGEIIRKARAANK